MPLRQLALAQLEASLCAAHVEEFRAELHSVHQSTGMAFRREKVDEPLHHEVSELGSECGGLGIIDPVNSGQIASDGVDGDREGLGLSVWAEAGDQLRRLGDRLEVGGHRRRLPMSLVK
jgi:hypothetical protein